jgi:general secretion pathway protein G
MKLPSHSTRSRDGFTLLEIMLVVMIIALLAGSAIYLMGGNLGYAQEVRVKADLQTIDMQLKLYQSANGFLPTTEQGLQALVTRPDTDPKPTQWRQLIPKVPLDPWNNPYIYENPGKHNQDSYDLYSAGSKPGSSDPIGNWDTSSSGK